MDAESPGLRERKRLATRHRIQLAVLALTAEKGFERVTVDEVSARADISSRTFFNYFPSKEAAAVGDAPGLPDGEVLDAFIAAAPGDDLFGGIAELLVRSVESSLDDVAMQTDRRRILHQYPQLFAMRMASMHEFEAALAAVIARRFAHVDPALATDSAALADRARLASLIAMGGLRHAWTGWADSDGASPLPVRIRESFDLLARLNDSVAASR